MAEPIKWLMNYYAELEKLADKRTRGWLLVDSPLPTFILVMIYLFIVWQGPKYMKK
jgi:elongation of very long chain fatty acids protein 4